MKYKKKKLHLMKSKRSTKQTEEILEYILIQI